MADATQHYPDCLAIGPLTQAPRLAVTVPGSKSLTNRASSVRTLTHLAVNRMGDWLWLDVEADGFLYNMVRAIAGTLMNVGRGYWPEEQVEKILEAGDRTQAGPTAPACGLFLVRVTY